MITIRGDVDSGSVQLHTSGPICIRTVIRRPKRKAGGHFTYVYLTSRAAKRLGEKLIKAARRGRAVRTSSSA